MAEVLECLNSKCEALSLNSSTAKKNHGLKIIPTTVDVALFGNRVDVDAISQIKWTH
jgi:hypothetical protein